jgi:hypothetical protein
MMFGRAFEQAIAAYFRREDPAAVFFREWAVYQNANLEYSRGNSWDRLLQQGIQLLERFAQDDRVRVRQPRRNLQIKVSHALSDKNDLSPTLTRSGISMEPNTCSSGRLRRVVIRKSPKG